MILLSTDCLLFTLSNGETVPVNEETVSVELIGGVGAGVDPETIRHATAAVFHYFKKELGCRSVSVEQFAQALEKVLRGFGLQLHTSGKKAQAVAQTDDLSEIAETHCEELLFYPELRRVVRLQLRHAPKVVRFHGLRGCVKQLTGARRWSPRCEAVRDQIVEYLRQCLSAEPKPDDCLLLVK